MREHGPCSKSREAYVDRVWQGDELIEYGWRNWPAQMLWKPESHVKEPKFIPKARGYL